jgi:tetratricopeptide (TPR) repeat protein
MKKRSPGLDGVFRGRKKVNLMIRLPKVIFAVLAVSCIAFAQVSEKPAAPADKNLSGAYYHFAMGRLYAEMAGSSANQNQNIVKAIQHYQEALKLDPKSGMILEELTDIYMQTGRMQDAVSQAEDLLKQDPDNLEARKTLARIYTRLIANPQDSASSTNKAQSDRMVRQAIEQYQKITEKDPKDADSWVMLGKLDRVANDAPAAEKAFNSALAVDPDNEDALTGLALLYSDQGDTAKAIEKLKTATDKNPNERTFSALAESYERVRDFKNAAEALKRAVELSPDDNRLQAGLAQDLLFSDQPDKALEIYQQLADDEPKEAQYQLRIAEIYRSKNDLAKAREALDRAKKLDSGDMSVAYEDVNLLEAENKTPQAITALKSLIESTARRSYSQAQMNNRALLLKRLGFLYRNENQYDQAIETFRQMADLGPENAVDSEALVIDTYRLARDFDNATKEADTAVAKYPNERSIRLAHAEVLGDKGKIDEAAAEVKALLNGKQDRETQMALAQVYEKGKRWTEVGKALDAAEKLSNNDDEKSAVHFMRGAMYERMKKYDEAESEFRKTLKIDPDNAGALNYLGYMLADRGLRLDEAHDMIKRALELDPRNGAYLDSMGWVYYRQGKLNEAEDALVRALDQMAQDPTVHDHLGDVYLKLGKTKEAIAQWQASLKEYDRSAVPDRDPEAVTKVSKKLEGARVKLARETGPQK